MNGASAIAILITSVTLKMYDFMYSLKTTACLNFSFSYTIQVDTEICEQTFSWLSRYARITRHMNNSHFKFYILYLCDLHNRKLSV